MNLLYNSEIIGSTNVTTADSTTYGKPFKMDDAEGCLFIVAGTSTLKSIGSSAYLSAQCCSSTGGTFVKVGSTTVCKSTEGGIGGKRMMVLDLYKPVLNNRPYVRSALRGSSDIHTVVAIKYGMRAPGATELRDYSQIAYGADIGGTT